MSRQGQVAMTMSSSGIPFPLGSSEGSILKGNYDGESSSIQGRFQEATTIRPRSDSFSENRKPLQDQTYDDGDNQSFRHMHLSNASTTSTASSTQGESLPSIRNLLHSIGQGDSSSDSSLSTLRRSPSAPNSSRYNNVSDSAKKSFRAPSSSSEGRPSAWEAAAASAYTREIQESTRSTSPQRRPPIAPSAFAHSQYHNQMASQPNIVQYRNEATQSSLSGPANQFRSIASFNRGISRNDLQNKKPRNLHSHSSSIPSITSEELSDVSVPSLSRQSRGEEEYLPLKRQSPPSADRLTRERSDRSPAASRRRHTVGALEEPIHLHETGHNYNLEQQRMRSSDVESTTPKSHQQYSRHVVPEGSDRVVLTPASQNSRRKEGHSKGDGASHTAIKPMHLLYMQHTDTGTGSLPSLISSTSTTSLVSERNRVHSMEEAKERRGVYLRGGWGMPAAAPPSQFYAMGKPPSLNPMDAIASPESRALHSRSSTLESVETNASLNSNHYQHNRPLPPPRSSSLRFEGDTSLPWPLTPTRRSCEAHMTTFRGDDRVSTERRKYESLRDGVTPQSYPYDVTVSAASRRSSVDAVNGYGRPRAQTMSYSDRPIAPLPSHSQSSSYLYSTSDSPYSSRAGRSNSSLSVSSVNSLPQRVSSMEINADQNRLRRYQDNVSNSSLSSEVNVSQSNSNATTIPIQTRFTSNSSSGLVGNTNGSAKYECGWCGKRFSRPSSLKIHHHSHTGEKPFACPAPNCGRTFSVQSNLRRHQKCHSSNTVAGSGLKSEVNDMQSSMLVGSVPFQQQQGYSTTHQMSQQPRYMTSSIPHKGSSMISSGDRLTPQQAAMIRMTSQATSHVGQFMQTRERRPSLQSSTAEDEEGEMEEGDEEQMAERSMKEEDEEEEEMDEEDKSMQDIQEEVETIHGSGSHHHSVGSQDEHVRPALHGLLNPAMAT